MHVFLIIKDLGIENKIMPFPYAHARPTRQKMFFDRERASQ